MKCSSILYSNVFTVQPGKSQDALAHKHDILIIVKKNIMWIYFKIIFHLRDWAISYNVKLSLVAIKMTNTFVLSYVQCPQSTTFSLARAWGYTSLLNKGNKVNKSLVFHDKSCQIWIGKKTILCVSGYHVIISNFLTIE